MDPVQNQQTDPLRDALQLLDESAAIIQELTAQIQSKGKDEDMSKKAEEVAVKLNVSFSQASDMIKTASESGESIDAMVKMATIMRQNRSFGSVYTEDKVIPLSGSKAIDSFIEKQAALMDELGLDEN